MPGTTSTFPEARLKTMLGNKASLAVLAVAVILYIRDARVANRSSPVSDTSTGGDPFSVDDDAVDFDVDDFGSDNLGTDSTTRQAQPGSQDFDEFNFHMDYTDEDEDDDFAGASGGDFANANFGDHRLLIRFDDIQYADQFESVKTALESHYPQLRGNVRGEKYPAPRFWQMVSSGVKILPIILLAIVFAGDKIFTALGLPLDVLEKIKANRLYVLPALFLFNMFVAPKVLATNAFEVVYNGAVVFSKLRTGVLPVGSDLPQLVAALRAAGLEPHSAFGR